MWTQSLSLWCWTRTPETKLIPDIPTSKLLLLVALLFCFELLKNRRQDGTEQNKIEQERLCEERF
jgi:hypothetical protein